MNATTTCNDAALGPVVEGCRDNFDFTLAFEQYFFTLAPSLLFLLVAPVRIASLRKTPTRVQGQPLRIAKLVAIILSSLLQLTLLILWATETTIQGSRTTALAASALALAAGLALLPLSYIEHARSLRPSLVASAYLAISVLLDGATLRTLWISSNPTTQNISNNTSPQIRNVYTASFALKLIVLSLEAVGKRKFFLDGYRDRSPEESSGLFGQGLLLWLNDIVFYGARHVLKPESLYPVTEDMSSEGLSLRFWEVWTKGQDQNPKPALNKILLKLLRGPIIVPVLPRLALLALTLCQPLMLQRLLAYLEDSEQRQDPKIGYALIGATVIIYIGMAISAAVYWHRHYRFMAMLRGILITSVFKKASLLPTNDATNAKTVTLMSADCERIVRGLLPLHDLWADVSQVAIATYLIETQLGVACVAPIAVTLITAGLTIYFANLTPGYQLMWVEKLETRIGITSSVLSAMKAIKITNLTSKAGILLNKLRKDELDSAKKFRIIQIITATVATVPQLISPVITFAVYIGVARRNPEDSTLNATNMFTTLSLLLLIGEPLFSLFEGMISLMTALGCLKRVEEFLHAPVREDKRLFLRHLDHPGSTQNDACLEGLSSSIVDGTAGILIENGRFGWDEEAEKPLLKDITLHIPAGKVTTIVGPVGCGKSSLIKAILGETPVWEGKMVLSDADVAYCDQSPWIMNETIRTNMTYASAFDAELYATVLRSCELNSDLASMAKGDMTVVGSKGFSLSAGQRQRVALARAAYSRKKIALLDDVFSQLDASTQMVVARRLLGKSGLFREWGTTVVLTSSSSRFLSLSDQVIALNAEGNLAQCGPFKALVKVDGYVRDISRDQSTDDNDFGHDDVVDTETGVMFSNDNPAEIKSEDAINVASTTPSAPHSSPDNSSSKPPETESSIYKYYISSIPTPSLITFLIFQTLVAFLSCFSYIWLKWWTDDSTLFPYGTSAYYITIYTLLQTLAILFTFLSTLFCLNSLAVITGLKLHSTLTHTVTSASLKLFSTTDTGTILNRFTQDIQLADIQLPLSVLVCVGHSLAVIGQAGLIASASGWIALSYPFLFAVFWYIPRYYVRTARQMRTLDLEEKAPIYAQFLETLEGLHTLRAFAYTHKAITHNYTLVDRSQRPWYLMYVIQKWLGVVLDLVIAGLAILVVGLSVGLRNSGSGAGFTGVSLTQIVSFTSYLKLLILFWAQLQMCMSAVKRIRDFSEETEVEGGNGRTMGEREVPSEWPARGGIVIKGLSAKYNADATDFVLNDINLEVKPGEKVCICGRTGSGKSSLVLALFRLLDPTSGSITIDDIDISSISRDTIRSQIVGVAEEPFFLPGTVRENMVPWSQDDGEEGMSDEKIIDILREVGLWGTEKTDKKCDADDVTVGTGGNVYSDDDKVGEETGSAYEKPDKGATNGKLDSKEGGLSASVDKDSLSAGQKQLFNIARATLRDKQVYVFDEVTSSLDASSERLFTSLLTTHLKSRTVMAVIHKLAFAKTFDKVAVMHEGRIVEFDTPANLLAKESRSRFGELCRAQGVAL